MALDVSMMLRLVDRFTGPAKRMAASAKGLAGRAGLGGLERGGEAAARGLGRAAGAGTRLPGIFSRARAAAERLASRSLPMLHRAAEATGRGIGSLVRKVGGLAAGAAKWVAAGAVFAGGGFIAGIIETASEFEQMRVQLDLLEGSAAKGKAALDWVSKFAGETPYELGQVTEAFVMARNLGIDPMTGALRTMGDAASANRRTIIDAIEAIGDAQTGEFERMKGFGITSASKGAMVTFSYVDKAGKAATVAVKKNATDIRGALLGIWDAKFGGTMIAQSTTFSGIWTNIKDQFARFQLLIANAGFFDKIKASAQKLLDKITVMANDGSLKAWADKISDGLSIMVDKGTAFVTGTDWGSVATQMKNIASAAGAIASGIVTIIDAWNRASTALAGYNQTLSDYEAAVSILPAWDVGGKRMWGTTDAEQAAARQRLGYTADGRVDKASERAAKFSDGLNASTAPTNTGRASKGMRAVSPAPARKISSLDLSQKLHVQISAPAGYGVTARPVETAPGTNWSLSRTNRGQAMGAA